ncbi:Serine/threonine-protein kinase STY8 [Hypsizygus marmoreus]|uniref:Serine/threonine-protein kinase STY8 n=1 Tax=Hypsizygus marmoreus TaxID=39966 RepID=A0A369JR25_HYPMA|nr:Serine/threonine-protein kinase STY8 [Hypsizygus marmoreus]
MPNRAIKAMTGGIPHHIPHFIWKFWLSQTGPTGLPRDPRVHIYDVYDNELSETREPPVTSRLVFQDFASGPSTEALVKAAEQAFYALEREAESTLAGVVTCTYSSGNPSKTTSFSFDKHRITKLCRYLVFLRFRNSAKYREVLDSLAKPVGDDAPGLIGPAYGPAIAEHSRRSILRGITAFLEHSADDARPPRRRIPKWPHAAGDSLYVFRTAMETYCWRLCDAEVCVGVAAEQQEFILTDSCFGTLDEGFEEDPDCCDLFFPIHPTLALYILGNIDPDSGSSAVNLTASPFMKMDVGIESASDVHLRNSMILQTYPHHLYFSALRSVALSVSSYDEFRWIQEHQDYSRLKQRCRQKFLQETVTKTLVVKGSVILTDLTDEIAPIGSSAVSHGAFSDVWKAEWRDPVEKRTRIVALKVLRQIMVKNVQEKLMKRLQVEVIAWHRLCHRNVSQLFGIVQFQNSIGMVSPWCEHGTICHYLKVNTNANRLNIIIQIASGVAYLHSATPVVVHGDLKGGNILVDDHGCPIITDFGLSKVIEEMSDSINIGSSFFAGSTRWMAPELILALVEDDGQLPPITTFSDVYAFASVCLEIATGQIPYPHRTNDHAVTVDILRGIKPSRGAHCHIQLKDEDAFWRLLDRCWNQACYLRPTMPELVLFLETLTETQTDTTFTAPPPPPLSLSCDVPALDVRLFDISTRPSPRKDPLP